MQPFIGQIQAFPYTFAPREWTLCDGKELAINEHQALFSLIGNVFGGDGRKTFRLPNLLGGEPDPNMKYYLALKGIYPPRN